MSTVKGLLTRLIWRVDHIVPIYMMEMNMQMEWKGTWKWNGY